ncbi:MAG: hypothetical protein M1814_004928 [Vezdaea aestivalis]|nr:MAG: hypothetical protein M1814_004928 [Vezdaea aestivalis]
MSKTVVINSAAQFKSLLSSSTVVVTDFHADWCGPCKAIAPVYEQLSAKLSRPKKLTFVKVDVDKQQEIAQTYGITAMPTFMIFKDKAVVTTIRGADPKQLSEVVQKLAREAESSGSGFEASGSDSDSWHGAELPRGYKDITDEIEIRGLDLLNADSEYAPARMLFNATKPSGRKSLEETEGKGKGAASEGSPTPDWIESDTDQQLMLFIPFMANLKVHTLQITSLPPKPTADSEGADEFPMRPKTINVYSNRAHVLGFDEAEDIPATQSITLSERDWDEKTGTAKVELRFVKFQSVNSLVVFIVDGHGESEKVRIDRIRVIGESGDKRDPGKLEKVGED